MLYFETTTNDVYKFHYVIAQCFAQVKDEFQVKQNMKPSDDALDAKWWTISEIKELNESPANICWCRQSD